jgi:RNA polymerase-binding transcription factor DksA
MPQSSSVTQRYKHRLLDRLEKLDTRLHAIESVLEEPGPADTEERATEREDDEVLEGLGNAGLEEIKQIKHALVRVDNDAYGICTACGEDISTERLDLIPHTPMCRHCA